MYQSSATSFERLIGMTNHFAIWIWKLIYLLYSLCANVRAWRASFSFQYIQNTDGNSQTMYCILQYIYTYIYRWELASASTEMTMKCYTNMQSTLHTVFYTAWNVYNSLVTRPTIAIVCSWRYCAVRGVQCMCMHSTYSYINETDWHINIYSEDIIRVVQKVHEARKGSDDLRSTECFNTSGD